MSHPAHPEPNSDATPKGLWDYGEDRLADLGALIVFRHWLRGLVKDQADTKAALHDLRPTSGPEVEPRYGRLFF